MATIKGLMDLSGRRAVITGGAGNIGGAIAETLAELGCKIVLLDRPQADFDNICSRILDNYGIPVDTIVCDLEDEQERAGAIEKVKSRYASVNILINNAAFVGESDLSGWVTSFEDQTVDTWRRALEVNLTAVFDLCKGCQKLMAESDGGSIINVSSIYGISGPDLSLYEGTQMGNPAAYAASKGGLVQLTRWLSTVLAPDIRVNCVSPGGVFRNQDAAFVERYNKRTPLQRMATEDDFKGVMAFLATDMSQYCTGQNIIVDGGWTCW